MRPFHTIAIPHEDILKGRLTMDVFAADLWEVHRRRGPEEYRDADLFFRKTYITEGLKNLFSVVEKRLKGEGGDPVIQIQTPFGGGKTHALIALYHRAMSKKVKTAVIVGTVLNPEETTLWGTLEEQLTGSVRRCSGKNSPGRDVLREVLSTHAPVLILMDEVLEYVTKASAIKVGESTLAAQTIAFMHELTECAGICGNVCLVVTLPASLLEHYDRNAESLFQQLQKVSGRVEKIYTPVQDYEITSIIRRRLFSSVDEREAKNTIAEFMNYVEREGLIPAGMESSEYRERFISSFPFMPEVVDTLYHRWGSFVTFQRTRGVLRLLSLVIHALKEKNIPYISLADFDLSSQEIRQELLKHIGQEYNSVIAADITSPNAGANLVDSSLGKSYLGLNLGRRTTTTIFMYSFSGGAEKGATMGEIRRSATTLNNPSSVIVAALDELKQKLFYLQTTGDRFYFKNQPNLNRIILNKMENITQAELKEAEKRLLTENLSRNKLQVYLWAENSADIPDSEDLKLIVLQSEKNEVMEKIRATKGSTPRVNRNTIFFLCPQESERIAFTNALKKYLAIERILNDKEVGIPEEQKKELAKELKGAQESTREMLYRLYQVLSIPGKEPYPIGVPTYGERKTLDVRVYDELRSAKEILEHVSPLFIKQKYLSNSKSVPTLQIYQATLRTPGEPRLLSKSVLIDAINKGVRDGLFGLGYEEKGKPECRYFKINPEVSISEGEILLDASLCRVEPEPAPAPVVEDSAQTESITPYVKPTKPSSSVLKELTFQFEVPQGKASDISRVVNFITSKFRHVEISLKAEEGEITEQEVNDRIEEAFNQMGIRWRRGI